MFKIVGGVLVGLSVLVLAYAFWPASDQTSRVAVQQSVQSPEISGSSKKQNPKRVLMAMKGVQKFCVDQFEMTSCLVYFSECEEQCQAILDVSHRVKILTAFNAYLVKHGQKPYHYTIPARASGSVIGQ
jgi:hypothetical protein